MPSDGTGARSWVGQRQVRGGGMGGAGTTTALYPVSSMPFLLLLAGSDQNSDAFPFSQRDSSFKECHREGPSHLRLEGRHGVRSGVIVETPEVISSNLSLPRCRSEMPVKPWHPAFHYSERRMKIKNT